PAGRRRQRTPARRPRRVLLVGRIGPGPWRFRFVVPRAGQIAVLRVVLRVDGARGIRGAGRAWWTSGAAGSRGTRGPGLGAGAPSLAARIAGPAARTPKLAARIAGPAAGTGRAGAGAADRTAGT